MKLLISLLAFGIIAEFFTLLYLVGGICNH
jgi:hypothetical protein